MCAPTPPSPFVTLRFGSRLPGWLCATGALVAVSLTIHAAPQISEVMAANVSTLADDDGTYSDWIEIANPGPDPVSLAGWYLTDNASNRAKWQFPAVSIPAGGYLVVFASGKDRRDPAQPLHTNFRLDSEGEYVGLCQPDGETVASHFYPAFPPQSEDRSYGRVQTFFGRGSEDGYLRQPTPGSSNGGRSALLLSETVIVSPAPGPFSPPFELVLAGAGPGQKIRYVIAAPSPSGADIPEPTAASPEYSGPIPIKSTVVVRAAVFSQDGIVSGPVATSHYVQLAPSLAGFSSKLPVLVLDSHGLGRLVKDGVDHPAFLYAYPPAAAISSAAPSLATPATLSLRGNFSSRFLKQSYSLTLRDEHGRGCKQDLVGLGAHEDWVLVSPWLTDRSYIRNAFVYALSNRIGRWAPRTRFVEMFVNEYGDGLERSDYYGIGVVTDRIKIGRDRVAITPLDPSDRDPKTITGGYIVKLDAVPDATHYNFITDYGIPNMEDTAIVVYSPKADKLSASQRDYIRGHVQQMENALFADAGSRFASRTHLDYIDVPSWVDHHILELFVANVDGLYRSEYFSKDRSGKMVAGPVWDFDGSMGSGDERNLAWDTWATAGDVDLWNYGWFGLLTKDPEFMQAWIDRWQSLRQDAFADLNLTGLADSLAAEVGPEAAARDAARWVDNQSHYPGGFLGEVAHLKNWITHRAGWIDRQFAASPAVARSGGSLVFTAPAGVQLAYTLDGSDPRALGGAIAPNALLTSEPLVVPATANVHVRCYDVARAAIFPGSPWSSAAGGASSSPLTPLARLVNLSSRAFVGSDEDTLITGVAIADTAGRGFIARAIGPALASFGTSHALPDPTLRLFTANGVELLRNTGWQNSPDADVLPALTRRVGAFPLADGSADSARLASLGAGVYTVHVSSSTGKTGVGLAEFYPYDDNGRTSNVSIRARVRADEGSIIGGFVLQGPAYKRMLIRAVGPTLGSFGVSDALADPVMTIYSGMTTVASNDDWSASGAALVAAASTAIGAFPLPDGSRDSGLLITLPPGAYTVELRGRDNTEGVALLEIYTVP